MALVIKGRENSRGRVERERKKKNIGRRVKTKIIINTKIGRKRELRKR